MKQWYLVIDVRWCHDCNNCFMSCKDEYVGNEWPGYTNAQPRHGHRWMNIQRRERGRYARTIIPICRCHVSTARTVRLLMPDMQQEEKMVS